MELFAEKRILSVSQLTRLITGVLEENFEHVWVEGEVSNLATPASGHLYFTLKDAGAQIRCVLFRASARVLKFMPKDGMRLILRGRVSLFAMRGEYQLIAEYLEPQGIGALQMAFLQLKERLSKEGLFDEKRKRPIPTLPQRVGIVTSPTGAAIHDILNVLDRRFANIHILLAPVKVQGEGAAGEIAAAIRDCNLYARLDVLIVGRGGGSIEDLWAFNEEVVARAIAASRIPVISAVGHEVDLTISDLVADLRASTPSAAAELVISSKADLNSSLESLELRLERAMAGRLSDLRGRLRGANRALRDPVMLMESLSQRLDFLQERMESSVKGMVEHHHQGCSSLVTRLRMKNPSLLVEAGRERVQLYSDRGGRAIQVHLARTRENIARCSASLQALSPLATLGRGYSIASRTTDGMVIRDCRQLEVGERINLRLARGKVLCTVEETEHSQ